MSFFTKQFLATEYKKIRKILPHLKWIDFWRKSTRNAVRDAYEQAKLKMKKEIEEFEKKFQKR